VTDQYPLNAEEFARANDLQDGKRLRQLIRDKKLMPQHRHGERYEIRAEDAARIRRDPDVRVLLG
jgi:hypothetical protein